VTARQLLIGRGLSAPIMVRMDQEDRDMAWDFALSAKSVRRPATAQP
jgi:hypothetical protein